MHRALLTSLLALLALTACDDEGAGAGDEASPPPKPRLRTAVAHSQLAEVCDGATFDGAPAYDPKGKALHPVAVFEKYVDAHEPAYELATSSYLNDWKGEPAAIELVACLDVKKKEKIRSCDFEGGKKLELWDMSHELVVREAKSGKVLLKKSFDLSGNQRCPSSSWFSSNVMFKGGDYAPRIVSDMLELQPKDVPMPKLSSYLDLKNVCDGVAYPQTVAYEPGKKAAVYVTYRADEASPYTHENRPLGLAISGGKLEDDAHAYHLVACVTGKPASKLRDCKFQGDSVVELMKGEVEVKLVATATGKVVETKTFSANGRECPFTYKFDADQTKGAMLGTVDDAFKSYVEGFLPPSK